jgi:YD repeat-containing protein
MNIIELLDKLKNLNINATQREIAETWGMNEQSFSKKKRQGTAIKYKNLKQIEERYNIVLTQSTLETAKLIDSIEEKRQVNDKLIEIEYFPDVYLSAGYGVEVLDEYSETVVIDERFLMSERGMRVNPKYCKMVCVSGNSMFPEYHHGDRVIIDESDTNLTDGQIYAFRYDGQCYVKEINRAGNKIKCISVNKEYEPFYIERDVDFKVFGRILPRIRL